jgi:hypothetical protein
MRRHVMQYVVAAILFAMVGGSMGCLPSLFPTELPAFMAGWILRGLSIQSGNEGLTCFRNGVQVDCSEVPGDLIP